MIWDGVSPLRCMYGLIVERPASARETHRECGEPAEYWGAGLPYCRAHVTGKYSTGAERLLRAGDRLDV